MWLDIQKPDLIDVVPCFKVCYWPSLARNNNILCPERIREKGCRVVCVPHPQSVNPNIKFGLSFSYSERYLVRSRTLFQLRCYYLCKE